MPGRRLLNEPAFKEQGFMATKYAPAIACCRG